jgi:MFS family permease
MLALPALWVFQADVWYLIIIQFLGGFLWAGFEISTFNFLFDTTTPSKRVKFISYYNVLNGIAIFLGALSGSILVKYNNLFESKYFLVFVLSFILRLTASIIFIPRLKEVRDVEHISYHRLLLKVVATIPTKGLVFAPAPFRKR